MGGSSLICSLAKNFTIKYYNSNKLNRARPNLYMLSNNPNVSLKIIDCSLFTRRFLVAEPNHQNLKQNLERESAHSISSKPVYSGNYFNNALI